MPRLERKGDNVRIGPISIITLIAIVCMAVLAMLSVSTAHATSVIAQRQAEATQQLYAVERAAQEFAASLDDVLAGVRADGGDPMATVKRNLEAICDNARNIGSADEDVTVDASMDGQVVSAALTCGGGRQLNIAITIRDDATYRIDQWKASAVQQEPQSAGNLWAGA